MKFSVLMSLYDKEEPDYFEACLSSLDKQTKRANEIVIVVDGPINEKLDGVLDKWLGKLPINIVRLPVNKGLGIALNKGLTNCKYNLVARMDTDDICISDRFEKQIEAFKNNSSLSVCGGDIVEVDPITLDVISDRTVPYDFSIIKKSLVWKNPFNHMTVMYRKDHVLDVGSYQHLPFMEDWYLWLRLLEKNYQAINLKSTLVKARTGNGMLFRRSGKNYIKSEWIMTRYKIRSEIYSSALCYTSFLIRSIPRLLPQTLLSYIYSLSRKV